MGVVGGRGMGGEWVGIESEVTLGGCWGGSGRARGWHLRGIGLTVGGHWVGVETEVMLGWHWVGNGMAFDGHWVDSGWALG